MTGKPPPWLGACARASLRSGDAGEAAARELRRWERLERYGDAVAAALSLAEVACVDVRGLTPTGEALAASGVDPSGDSEADGVQRRGALRVAVDGVWMGGRMLALPDARAVRDDWMADPARSAARVRGCRSAWLVGAGPQGHRATPLTCGDTVCPYCVTQRTAPRRQAVAAALSSLRADGYTICMITRTRRARMGSAPVVWTDDDARRWGPCPHRGPDADRGEDGGYAVPGESLGAAWDDLARGWRAMIDGRELVEWGGALVPRRDWWAETVAATADAVEATQVRTRWAGHGPDRRRVVDALRWHVHGHTIVALAPGVIGPDDVVERSVRSHRQGRPARRVRCLASSCAWWSTYLAAWGAEVDAEERGQDAIVVDDDADALRELMKYPGKLSEMTSAGIVEWLVTAKGRRPQRLGGGLHGSTWLGCVAAARAALLVGEGEGPADGEGPQGALDRLRRRLVRAGVDVDAPALRDPVALVEAGRSRVGSGWRHVDPVSRALAAAWGRERAAAACVVRPMAVDVDGRRRALTVDLLDALIRQGVRQLVAWDLHDGVRVGELDLVDLRREIRSWRWTGADPTG